MTFEEAVEKSGKALDLKAHNASTVYLVAALEVLVAEREAIRLMTKAAYGRYDMVPPPPTTPKPVSYSHWGMIA